MYNIVDKTLILHHATTVFPKFSISFIDWGKEYRLYKSGSIIACAVSSGCYQSLSNFDQRNPAQIWRDDRTGTYRRAVDPKNKYMACSAQKQYQRDLGEDGWSIWCLFMSSF